MASMPGILVHSRSAPPATRGACWQFRSSGDLRITEAPVFGPARAAAHVEVTGGSAARNTPTAIRATAPCARADIVRTPTPTGRGVGNEI
jgi:hypothetical protein